MKSSIDLTSRMSRIQARKKLSEFLKLKPNRIIQTKHFKQEMANDDLIMNDVINVLHKGQILEDPEFENGSYRYRVQTNKIVVVIAFNNPDRIILVTTWRK